NWNEVYYANLRVTSSQNRALPVVTSLFNSVFSYNYTNTFAALTVLVLPGLLFYALAQKQGQNSVAAAGTKGSGVIPMRTIALDGLWQGTLPGSQPQPMQVPGCFDSYTEQKDIAQPVIFERQFDLALEKDMQYALSFEAVSYYCEIYVN